MLKIMLFERFSNGARNNLICKISKRCLKLKKMSDFQTVLKIMLFVRFANGARNNFICKISKRCLE